MATDDNNQDNDQDDFFGDEEEDFGLPELDYEALDSDSDEDTVEEDDFTFGDESVDDEITDQNLDEEDVQSDKPVDGFYEEESYDDFETSEGDGDPSVLIQDEGYEDNLPPLEDEKITSPKKGKFAKVVIFGILIILGLGSTFWFMFIKGREKLEKSLTENKIEKPESESIENESKEVAQDSLSSTDESNPENDKTESIPEQKSAEVKKPVKKKPVVEKPTLVAENSGTVNVLSHRTGNYFIIIGSFINRDLANNYVKKLSNAGKSPSIIKSNDRTVKHRVTINGYVTLSEAQRAIEGFKGEFGRDIWVLKY